MASSSRQMSSGEDGDKSISPPVVEGPVRRF